MVVVARYEQDREDLLAEAKALVERVEFAWPAPELQRAAAADDGGQSSVRQNSAAQNIIYEGSLFVGFRRDGCGSIYLSPDEAWHFNTAGELRRAYLDGRLLKAEARRLVALTRQRTATETALVRHDLSEAEQRQTLARLATGLRRVQQLLCDGRLRVLGQVPAESDLLARVTSWLQSLALPPPVAQRPHAK